MDDLILNLKTHVANYHLGAAQDFKEVFDDVCEAIRRIEYYQKREVGCGDSDLLRENVALKLRCSEAMRDAMQSTNQIANLTAENESLRDQLENARFQLRSLTEERKLCEKDPDKSREEGGITNSFSQIIRENIQPIGKKNAQGREVLAAPMRKWDWLPREMRVFLLEYAEYTDSLEYFGGMGLIAKNVDAISRKQLHALLDELLHHIPNGVIGADKIATIANVKEIVSNMVSVEDMVSRGGKDNG